ncbi:MAG TPA: GNAT family N-acetyltransferase [Acidimicrobiales bacterium]|nr:GNAT family N-acetyltransferase [Acidimicrobiales bacterium]
MADPPPTVRVIDNQAKHRYEAYVGDALAATATYELTDGTIVFLHTETDAGFEGRGVASHLAQAALDDARAQGRRVIPRCPFFASYIDRHPAFADLVEAGR